MASVLFVCVKNGGKSQIAASLMRLKEGIEVHSCGTKPGTSVNGLAVQMLEEIGASASGEYPKGIDPEIVAGVDRVVILGEEADPRLFSQAQRVDVWTIDEPSHRGIEGEERMRLVRDHISRKVDSLYEEMTAGAEDTLH